MCKSCNNEFLKAQNKRDRKFELLNQSGRLLPTEGVATCLKNRVFGALDVGVSVNNDGIARYSRLQTCKSVWACPVCSSRIAIGRSAELERLAKRAVARGEVLHLVTLTHRHNKSHTLKELININRKAIRTTFNGNSYKRLAARHGIIGFVRTQEITHSEQNGWHNHYHLIVITKGEIDRKQLQKELAHRWQNAFKRATSDSSLYPNLTNGVDVANGSHAMKYIAKTADENSKRQWGLSQELAMSHAKKGSGGSRTPWDLLADSKDLKGNDSIRAGKLFIEYYQCVKGSKQMNWSANLKKMYNIAELDDEELLEQEEQAEQSKEIQAINPVLWNLIIKAKKRAEVLRACEDDYKNNTNEYELLCIQLLDNEIHNKVISKHTANIYSNVMQSIIKTLETVPI